VSAPVALDADEDDGKNWRERPKGYGPACWAGLEGEDGGQARAEMKKTKKGHREGEEKAREGEERA
jgi:hypothetical protein